MTGLVRSDIVVSIVKFSDAGGGKLRERTKSECVSATNTSAAMG